jgi:hypothetical protein
VLFPPCPPISDLDRKLTIAPCNLNEFDGRMKPYRGRPIDRGESRFGRLNFSGSKRFGL